MTPKLESITNDFVRLVEMELRSDKLHIIEALRMLTKDEFIDVLNDVLYLHELRALGWTLKESRGGIPEQKRHFASLSERFAELEKKLLKDGATL